MGRPTRGQGGRRKGITRFDAPKQTTNCNLADSLSAYRGQGWPFIILINKTVTPTSRRHHHRKPHHRHRHYSGAVFCYDLGARSRPPLHPRLPSLVCLLPTGHPAVAARFLLCCFCAVFFLHCFFASAIIVLSLHYFRLVIYTS